MVTWCGWHPEDLLAEPGIFFSWVCVCLCVQDLVHLGKHNLPQVEETLGGKSGVSLRLGKHHKGSQLAEQRGRSSMALPALAWRDLMSFSRRS